MTKFQGKLTSLQQVSRPNSQDNFQICRADMYLVRLLANFAGLRVFLWISRIYLKFAAPRPREISEALFKAARKQTIFGKALWRSRVIKRIMNPADNQKRHQQIRPNYTSTSLKVEYTIYLHKDHLWTSLLLLKYSGIKWRQESTLDTESWMTFSEIEWYRVVGVANSGY